MDADLFLQQFGHLAQGEGGIKKLRDVILQLAVQGKLVKQNPVNEPAEALLKKIEVEKKRLIKVGTVKEVKTSPIPASISELGLPRGWRWVKLADLAYPQAGFAFKSGGFNEAKIGLPLIRIRDIGTSNPQTYYEGEYRTEFVVNHGDYLIGMDGDFRVAKWLGNQALLNQRVSRLIFYYEQLPKSMISIALQIELYKLQGVKAYTTVDHLSGKQIAESIISLPPLAEQKQIVAKVDELMALCDKLEAGLKAQHTLKTQAAKSTLHHITDAATPEDFANSFNIITNKFGVWFDNLSTVKNLRATILQLAVQGKLLPQNASDEPASELLKRIEAEKKLLSVRVKYAELNDISMLYLLPKTWQWTPLGRLVSTMDSGWSPACEVYPATNEQNWGVLKTTAVQVMKYLEFENKALPSKLNSRPEIEVKAGDILITRAGPRNRVGISCLVEKTRPKLMISDKIIRFHLVGEFLYERYISLCLNTGETNKYIESAKSGMADSQLNISQDKLKSSPIPLPPFAEQKRIVAIVDELMKLCDQLESQITQFHTLNTHLMDSLIHRITQAA